MKTTKERKRNDIYLYEIYRSNRFNAVAIQIISNNSHSGMDRRMKKKKKMENGF